MLRAVAAPFGALLCALALIALLAPPVRSASPSSAGPAPRPTVAQADRRLAGQLLVATEGLQDSPFAHTVVYKIGRAHV